MNLLLKQSGSTNPSGTAGARAPWDFGLFWPCIIFLIGITVTIIAIYVIEKIKSNKNTKPKE